MKIVAMNPYQKNNNQTAFCGDKEVATTIAKFTKKPF